MKILKINILYIFLGLCIFAGISCAKEIQIQEFVAHAGGGVDGIIYTNSKEALDTSYFKGFRFFELDFDWTSDGKLVLVHYWAEDTLKRLFKAETKVYTFREFKKLKMIDNLTQMALDDLINWMSAYKDAYIITDVKSDNLRALKEISIRYSKLKERFIPQIYKYDEYDRVKNMGFKNTILTLYVMNYPDDEVIDFLRHNKISALTMWDYRANKDFIDKLKKLGIFIYAHTVNDAKLKTQLKGIGVDGFYTDFLEPSRKE